MVKYILNKPTIGFLILLVISINAKAQQADLVDFLSITATIKPIPAKKLVKGEVKVTFEVISDADSLYLDAINMRLTPKSVSNSEIAISIDSQKIWFKHKFKAKQTYNVSFTYEAYPKKAMYFIGWEDLESVKQIWTQGQGKYSSHWLPSIDDMNEKIEFDLSVDFDSNYEVIANGVLKEVNAINDSINRWQFDMQKPMSSYLVSLAIGKFNKNRVLSNSGISLDMYYQEHDSLLVEPTYRYTKRIFDFLEEEIGVLYPWQVYKQIPVKDFLYAGMENTTSTIFADSFMSDSIAFNDRNYVNVNAHELAHQWFGNMITAKSGTHHWLQEGFATYYALLAEKEIFGIEYYHWQLYQSAEQLIQLSKEGKGEALLNPAASSLTFYQKGAWLLHMLREEVGEAVFKNGVKLFLETYAFKNADTNDFIAVMETVSGRDLIQFFEPWLVEKHFLEVASMASLFKDDNMFIDRYFQVKNNDYMHASTRKSKERYQYLKEILASKFYYPAKQEVIKQIYDEPVYFRDSLMYLGIRSSDFKLRQYSLQRLEEIPDFLQNDIEKLLTDESYTTIENALYKLWLNFPNQRANYLNQTASIKGFSDLNVRITWLTLALVTKGYKEAEKGEFYKELSGYTAPKYGFEIRQNAFSYLYEIQALNDESIKNLIQAMQHHNWRFASFAKELFAKLAETETWKKRIQLISESLSESDQEFIENYIN
jgi:aminopeptidase N